MIDTRFGAFEFGSFEFVSYLEFRASDFRLGRLRHRKNGKEFSWIMPAL